MEEKFKKYIEKLLQINLELSSLFQANDFEIEMNESNFTNFQAKIEKLLIQKDSLINNLKILKELSEKEFSDLKNLKYKEIWQKIQELENKNLEMIKNGQIGLSEEMAGIKIHSKAISSYKFNKELKPRLFDNLL